MRDAGSIEYAQNLAARLTKEAWENLKECLPESEAKQNLRLVCEFVVKRTN